MSGEPCACSTRIAIPRPWRCYNTAACAPLPPHSLSLSQALWYYVQPPMLALRLVASLAAEASAGKLRGAALLDLLHQRCAAVMGDAQGHKLALRLLR